MTEPLKVSLVQDSTIHYVLNWLFGLVSWNSADSRSHSYENKLRVLLSCIGEPMPLEETECHLEACIRDWAAENLPALKMEMVLEGKRISNESCNLVLRCISVIAELSALRAHLKDGTSLVVIAGVKNAGKSTTAKVIFGADASPGVDSTTLYPVLLKSSISEGLQVIDMPGATEPRDTHRLADKFLRVGAIGAWCVVCLEIQSTAVSSDATKLTNQVLQEFSADRVIVVVTGCDLLPASDWDSKLEQISDCIPKAINRSSILLVSYFPKSDLSESVLNPEQAKELIMAKISPPYCD